MGVMLALKSVFLGYKKSGFSFTIGKKVFFKQKNIDGTLGSVCSY